MTDPDKSTFDYVVVGAGPAGITVASRLSEDPGVRVLLVEAGGPARGPIIDMPAAVPYAYQRTAIQWGYVSGPEPHLGGRTIDEKAGRIVGGSSSINAMLFNRGNPLDYDGWARDLGLTGWSYADVLPYFKRMETFEEGPDEWRGGDGPLRVSRCRAEHPLFTTFLRAGEQAGFEIAKDHNGFRQEGLHVAQAFIHRGVRWNAARGYLAPSLDRDNLALLTRAFVERVLVEDGRATGISVTGPIGPRVVRADREVIVSAGVFGSPKLLMVSGIGDADALRPLGIDVVAHVPQVGRNLENHPGVDVQFATRHEDSLTSQIGPLGKAWLGARWLATRSGLGASNLFEAGAFLRTRDDVAFPNMQYEFLPLTRKLVNGKLVPVPGFQFWMDLSRPESRGEVTLTSGDPAALPSIVFHHLEEEQDVLDLMAGVRLARDIARQPAFAGVRGEEMSPGADAVTDADLRTYLRERVGTSYHGTGTCRMGVGDEAVTDGEGRVKAVPGLRVVDASLIPKNVTGNLNAPVLMLAERISDLVRGRTLPTSDADYVGRAS
jgi:choline dehydrogenase